MLVGFHAELKFDLGVRATLENGSPPASGHVTVHIESLVRHLGGPDLVDTVGAVASSEVVGTIGEDLLKKNIEN
jgi:hypothetical protein